MTRLLGILIAALFSVPAWASLDSQPSEGLVARASQALEAADINLAHILAVEAAKSYPDDPDVFYLLGQVYYRQQKYDLAFSAWYKVLRFNREHKGALASLGELRKKFVSKAEQLRLAQIYYQLRLYENCSQLLSSLAAGGTLEEDERAEVLFLWAQSLNRQHLFNQSIELYEKFIKQFPSSNQVIEAYLEIIRTYAQDKDSALMAYAAADKFAARYPDVPERELVDIWLAGVTGRNTDLAMGLTKLRQIEDRGTPYLEELQYYIVTLLDRRKAATDPGRPLAFGAKILEAKLAFCMQFPQSPYIEELVYGFARQLLAGARQDDRTLTHYVRALLVDGSDQLVGRELALLVVDQLFTLAEGERKSVGDRGAVALYNQIYQVMIVLCETDNYNAVFREPEGVFSRLMRQVASFPLLVQNYTEIYLSTDLAYKDDVRLLIADRKIARAQELFEQEERYNQALSVFQEAYLQVEYILLNNSGKKAARRAAYKLQSIVEYYLKQERYRTALDFYETYLRTSGGSYKEDIRAWLVGAYYRAGHKSELAKNEREQLAGFYLRAVNLIDYFLRQYVNSTHLPEMMQVLSNIIQDYQQERAHRALKDINQVISNMPEHLVTELEFRLLHGKLAQKMHLLEQSGLRNLPEKYFAPDIASLRAYQTRYPNSRFAGEIARIVEQVAQIYLQVGSKDQALELLAFAAQLVPLQQKMRLKQIFYLLADYDPWALSVALDIRVFTDKFPNDDHSSLIFSRRVGDYRDRFVESSRGHIDRAQAHVEAVAAEFMQIKGRYEVAFNRYQELDMVADQFAGSQEEAEIKAAVLEQKKLSVLLSFQMQSTEEKLTLAGHKLVRLQGGFPTMMIERTEQPEYQDGSRGAAAFGDWRYLDQALEIALKCYNEGQGGEGGILAAAVVQYIADLLIDYRCYGPAAGYYQSIPGRSPFVDRMLIDDTVLRLRIKELADWLDVGRQDPDYLDKLVQMSTQLLTDLDRLRLQYGKDRSFLQELLLYRFEVLCLQADGYRWVDPYQVGWEYRKATSFFASSVGEIDSGFLPFYLSRIHSFISYYREIDDHDGIRYIYEQLERYFSSYLDREGPEGIWAEYMQYIRLRDPQRYANYLARSQGSQKVAATLELAAELKQLGRYTEAAAVLIIATEAYYDQAEYGQVLLSLGELFLEHRLYDNAADYFGRLDREYVGFPATIKRVVAYVYLDRWAEAISLLEGMENDALAGHISVLKEVARAQALLAREDCKSQAKTRVFIARSLRKVAEFQLKAAAEYAAIAQYCPDSELADDGLYQASELYNSYGMLAQAEQMSQRLMENYAESYYAEQALMLIARKYLERAEKLGEITTERYLKERYLETQEQFFVSSVGLLSGRDFLDDNAPVIAALNNLFDEYQRKLNYDPRLIAEVVESDRVENLRIAAQSLEQVCERFPRAAAAAWAYFTVGQLNFSELADAQKAVAAWGRLVAVYPDSAEAKQVWLPLADFYYDNQRYRDALGLYHSYLTKSALLPTEQLWYRRAVCLEHAELTNDAFKAYREYLERYPQGTYAADALVRSKAIGEGR